METTSAKALLSHSGGIWQQFVRDTGVEGRLPLGGGLLAMLLPLPEPGSLSWKMGMTEPTLQGLVYSGCLISRAAALLISYLK